MKLRLVADIAVLGPLKTEARLQLMPEHAMYKKEGLGWMLAPPRPDERSGVSRARSSSGTNPPSSWLGRSNSGQNETAMAMQRPAATWAIVKSIDKLEVECHCS